MKNKKKRQLIDEQIHAYICQSMVSSIFDIIVFIFFGTIFILTFSQNPTDADKDIILSILCPFIALYIIQSCLINHRVLIAALVDKIQNNIITETISPIKLKEDTQFKSYAITNNITIFYDKEMSVKKYKLFYRTDKKRFVRLIMSEKKRFKTCTEIINNTNIDKIQITYYKHSKMLISVALPKDKKYTKDEELSILRFNKTI